MKTLFAKITELGDDGWRVALPEGVTMKAETACDALGLVRSYGAGIAERGSSNAIVISWEATSTMGLLVVKAIAS